MYERYEKLRNSKGLKNSDISRKTGISNMTLSDWKRGVSTPKLDKIIKIANALDTNIDYITGKSDNPVSYKNMFPDREDEFESLIQQETEKENELLLEVQKMDDDKLSRLIQYAKFINSQND